MAGRVAAAATRALIDALVRTIPRAPANNSSALRGLGLGHPPLEVLGWRCRRAFEIEDDRRQVDAGDPVDERVVGLGDDREAIALQALDQPVLPQRLGSIQPLGRDPRGEQQQLLLGPRLGQRRVADVVGEVEVRIVDPQRTSGLQRRRGELLAVAGDQVQPAADVVGELVEVGRGPFEDQDPADVHVRGATLLMQERRIGGGQTIEMLLHGRSLWRRRSLTRKPTCGRSSG